MRFLAVTIACMACLCACADTDFKVMTFNVRYGTANDGEDHWDKRKDLLVDTIKQQDPVIMGSQECLDMQARYISEMLPEYRWVGIGRSVDGTGEMAAVHYKFGVLTPVEVRSFWLSETPEVPGSKSWDAAITRIVTYVKFFKWEDGKYIHFFNTHFDHRGKVARENSGKLLGERIAAITDGAPIIVTGDFNAEEEKSAPWTNLVERGGLMGAHGAAPEKSGPDTTWCGFKDPGPDAHSRIDWILFKNGVGVKRCDTIANKKDGRYPSDHFPVVAVLTLPF